jgi:hypothetical protein
MLRPYLIPYGNTFIWTSRKDFLEVLLKMDDLETYKVVVEVCMRYQVDPITMTILMISYLNTQGLIYQKASQTGLILRFQNYSRLLISARFGFKSQIGLSPKKAIQ